MGRSWLFHSSFQDSAWGMRCGHGEGCEDLPRKKHAQKSNSNKKSGGGVCMPRLIDSV